MKTNYPDVQSNELDQWQVMQTVILKEEYDTLLKMIAEGYKISFVLLETLYRLGQEDLIRKICDTAVSYDPTVEKFFRIHVGREMASKIISNIRTRYQIWEERARQAKAKKEQQEKERQQKEIDKLIRGGNKETLFRVVDKYGQWKYLISVLGQEKVFQDVHECWGRPYSKYERAADAFTLEFLLKKKAFDAIYLHAHFFGGETAVLSKICEIEGGVEFISSLGQYRTNEWLITHGYEDVFKKSGKHGYQVLAGHKELSFKELQEWYSLEPDEFTRLMTKENLLKTWGVKIAALFKK